MGENDKEHEEKREERQIIDRIDFDLDKDGFPIGIRGKSFSERNISYSLLVLVARLQVSIHGFRSSSDNNSKNISPDMGPILIRHYTNTCYFTICMRYIGRILEYPHPLFGWYNNLKLVKLADSHGNMGQILTRID